MRLGCHGNNLLPNLNLSSPSSLVALNHSQTAFRVPLPLYSTMGLLPARHQREKQRQRRTCMSILSLQPSTRQRKVRSCFSTSVLRFESNKSNATATYCFTRLMCLDRDCALRSLLNRCCFLFSSVFFSAFFFSSCIGFFSLQWQLKNRSGAIPPPPPPHHHRPQQNLDGLSRTSKAQRAFANVVCACVCVCVCVCVCACAMGTRG